MDDLEIIKKHLTPEVLFILKNEDGTEDKIMLKPLNVGQQTLAFSISKKMQKSNELDGKGEIINNIDSETMKEMFDLFISIIKRAVPNLDDETAENFVLTNFDGLSEVLESLISKPKSSEKIELLKKRMDQRRAEIAKDKEEKK